MSRPGNGTLPTLAKNVLEFETSKDADRDRFYWESVVSKRLTQGRIFEAGETRELLTRHRELRRLARRLAKKALEETNYLRSLVRSHDEEANVLEARITRMETNAEALKHESRWFGERDMARDAREKEATGIGLAVLKLWGEEQAAQRAKVAELEGTVEELTTRVNAYRFEIEGRIKVAGELRAENAALMGMLEPVEAKRAEAVERCARLIDQVCVAELPYKLADEIRTKLGPLEAYDAAGSGLDEG